MVYNYNSSLSQNFGYGTKVYTTETIGQAKFFVDYHSHSKQLVDALQEWVTKAKFTSCIYEQGIFDIDNREPVESMNKGFMRYMKKHLEKEDKYKQQILELICEIETNRKQLCKKIQDTMISPDPMAHSFQMIITDKIRSFCPKLNRTQKMDLEENNIYIASHIFKLISEKISNKESVIILKIIPSSISNSSILMYQDLFALAQGEFSDMDRLKTAIEQLANDNNIKKKLDEYTELEKQLMNHEKIDELNDKIDELWTYIHGGGYLGGLNACELCDHSKLAPTGI